MKLSQLAEKSGFSRASIKFFQREGLLAPPRLKNPTTGVYSAAHLSRLALIRYLRESLEVPLRTVGAVCALIDDPDVSDLDLMDACQVLGGTPRVFPAVSQHAPRDAGDAQPPESAASRRAAALVAELCERRHWPRENTLARVALETILTEMSEHGTDLPVEYLDALGATLAPIVEINLAAAGVGAASAQRDRNELALDVIRGVRLHTRILLAVSNLAHASASISALTGAHQEPLRTGPR